MELLANDELRESASVNSSNPYMFLCAQGSDNHVSGWHCVQHVCNMVGNLKKSNLLTATKMRHQASTIYASIDVPEGENLKKFKWWNCA